MKFKIGDVRDIDSEHSDIRNAENYIRSDDAAATGQQYFRATVSGISSRELLIDLAKRCGDTFMRQYFKTFGPVRYEDGHSCGTSTESTYGFYALTNQGHHAAIAAGEGNTYFIDLMKFVFDVGNDIPFEFRGVSYSYRVRVNTTNYMVYFVVKE